jgi:hypothetical protein
MTDQQIGTRDYAIGIVRSAAWSLGNITWPNDDAVTRIMLAALTPTRTLAHSKSPTNVLRRWLRQAEERGELLRGRTMIRAVDKAALAAFAVEGMGAWKASDFIDTAKARAEVGALLNDPHRLREKVVGSAPLAELRARLVRELDALAWWDTY